MQFVATALTCSFDRYLDTARLRDLPRRTGQTDHTEGVVVTLDGHRGDGEQRTEAGGCVYKRRRAKFSVLNMSLAIEQ